jgi:anti-sigma regulatory factor (Ser/Thr protein kinase)
MHEEGPEAGVSAPLDGTPTRVLVCGPAVAGQVATVRHAVLESAKAHGLGAGPRGDIALAVSKACTNVVLHAYRGATVPGMVFAPPRDPPPQERTATSSDQGSVENPAGTDAPET